MRKLTYLAVLEPSNDGYGVFFPDLPGCISLGDNIEEAQKNAREALELHIYGMEKDKEAIPSPSASLSPEDTEGCFVVPVTVFPDIVASEMNNRRVKTNVTIPAWLKELAEEKDVNYSRLLEFALVEYLGIKQAEL